jgi:C1A family cysteine protease
MMKAVLLFVALSALSVATAAPYVEAEYQYMFTKWMTQNEKHYEIEDFFNRYSVFKDNLNFINEHNAQNHSYTVGLNEFADLTSEEFGKRNTLDSASSPSPSALPHESKKNFKAPSSVDWRSKSVVVVVKNQGSCGSCYAFSSVSTMETGWAIHHGTLYGLSEQHLVDCSQVAPYNNLGCQGGSPEGAYGYAHVKGIANQATYPYTGVVGACRNVAVSPVKITGFRAIGANNEAAMLEAVAAQSILVEIEADKQVFQFYTGGVFDNTGCGTTLDHGVVIVGYGTDGGKNYWIVRNSWGGTWGEKGYIRIVRGKNMCGINNAPYYPIMA